MSMIPKERGIGGPPLTEDQQRLCLENIARCRAYAALPEDQKWPACLKNAVTDDRVVRAKRRTHTGVHHTYNAGRMATRIEDFERVA